MNFHCPVCGQKTGDDDSVVNGTLPVVPEHFPKGRMQQSGVAASGGGLVPICPGSGDVRPWVRLGPVEPLLGDEAEPEEPAV